MSSTVDPLSHSCPTCEGTGEVSCKCRGEFHVCAPPFSGPNPHCIDGYPREAVERAAAAVDCFEVFTADDGFSGIRPRDPMDIALAVIRAFHGKVAEATSPAAPAPLTQHNEGTE